MADLTAFDTYGKAFVRGLLREPDVLANVVYALQTLLEAGKASYTVVDIASEIGAMLPMPTTRQVSARPARRIPAKSRAA